MAVVKWGRPTFYNGIEMKSWLEADWAAVFDHIPFDWRYEPWGFRDRTTKYLPDFVIERPNGRQSFVEIKPPLTDDELASVKKRMETIWDSKPTAFLWLIHLDADNSLFNIELGIPADDNEPASWHSYHGYERADS